MPGDAQSSGKFDPLSGARPGRLRDLRIAVVGMGYVGLPTALALAVEGAEVLGLDIDEGRLADIKDNRVDMFARDLVELERVVAERLLVLAAEPSALDSVDAMIICVPTPIDAHFTPDLAALSSVCAQVVDHAQPGQTIVLASTTYVGCTDELLVKPLQARGFHVGRDIFVAFSPERIDPGVAEHRPDTTPRVVGGYTQACSDHAARFLSHTASELHMVASPEVGEMAKLLENTFRAVNIALANEFADAARIMNIDIVDVIEAASTKPYGFMPFYPGAGVGGHCIPCDPYYLLWQLRSRRVTSPVVEASMTGIAIRPRQVLARAQRILADDRRPIRSARILVLGVSYKPGVSDVRESPALAIIEMMAGEGAEVAFSDNYVAAIATQTVGQLYRVERPSEELWDLVVVHTIHPGQDCSWLASQAAVLDTTYRLEGIKGLHRL